MGSEWILGRLAWGVWIGFDCCERGDEPSGSCVTELVRCSNTASTCRNIWTFIGTYCLHLPSWRWRQYIPPKRWYLAKSSYCLLPTDQHRNPQSILRGTIIVRNKWLVLSNEMETRLAYLFYPRQFSEDRFLVTPYGTAESEWPEVTSPSCWLVLSTFTGNRYLKHCGMQCSHFLAEWKDVCN
jgi:hypothetical protein